MQHKIDKEALRQQFTQTKSWLWEPKRRPYTIFGAAVLFVLFLMLTKPGNEAVEREETSYPVETQTIVPRPLATTLYLYGTIESPTKSHIVSTVTSDVVATPLKEGAMIQPGELLIDMSPFEPKLVAQQRIADSREIEGLIKAENNRHEANLKALESEKVLLELLKKALGRQETLVKQQHTSEAAVDDAKRAVEQQTLTITSRELEIADHPARLEQLEARLNKAQALQAQAELDLKRTQIMSPFAGRVAQLYVAPLDRVTPGTQLIDIYNMEDLEVRAQIPSKYLSRLYAQMANGESIDAKAIVDGHTVDLQLDRLSGEVLQGRGGVDALFNVKQALPNLALGRPVDLLLSLENNTPVIAIPYPALYSYDRVFKVVDGRLKGITIERFGERINEQGETELLITSDELQDGDIIITSLLPNATSGMKVHRIED